jgi:hypothetical protein
MPMPLTSAPPTTIRVARLRAAVQNATDELAKYALGFTGATVSAPTAIDAVIAMIGAHVPLVGRQSFDIALVGTRDGCRGLAEAILGGGKLDDAQVADAIGELVNMLAGTVKRQVGLDHELGLPLFIHGYVQPTDRLSLAVFPVQLGPVAAMVVIAGPRGSIDLA